LKNHIRTFFVAASFMLLAAMPLQVIAHGGEDHGNEAAVLPSATVAPRAIAQSEEFELVAVLDGGKLTLTLDRFATNEPVADAQIEIDSGSVKAIATQIAPGTYIVSAENFVSPGTYLLTISIEAGETADLLSATLDLSIPAVGVEPPPASSGSLALGAKGSLLLAGGSILTLLAIRRYRNRSRS
jgi:hypothetical protein